MEPLDTDLEYALSEPHPAAPSSRMNTLLIFPMLGILLILIFIASAIFQWPLSDLVDGLVTLLLLLFFLFIVMIFWALAPRSNQA